MLKMKKPGEKKKEGKKKQGSTISEMLKETLTIAVVPIRTPQEKEQERIDEEENRKAMSRENSGQSDIVQIDFEREMAAENDSASAASFTIGEEDEEEVPSRRRVSSSISSRSSGQSCSSSDNVTTGPVSPIFMRKGRRGSNSNPDMLRGNSLEIKGIERTTSSAEKISRTPSIKSVPDIQRKISAGKISKSPSFAREGEKIARSPSLGDGKISKSPSLTSPAKSRSNSLPEGDKKKEEEAAAAGKKAKPKLTRKNTLESIKVKVVGMKDAVVETAVWAISPAEGALKEM